MTKEKLLWENLGLTKTECIEVQNFVFPHAASANKTTPSHDLSIIHTRYCDERKKLIFALFMYGEIHGIAKAIEQTGKKVSLDPNNVETAIEVGYLV